MQEISSSEPACDWLPVLADGQRPGILASGIIRTRARQTRGQRWPACDNQPKERFTKFEPFDGGRDPWTLGISGPSDFGGVV
ncbi:hypothetical protein [Bradyrhizobium ivorense]|uniref:hypothetical protein n=1 Tax=Bradyrhizobium ivorense TaxID=2511166 RepID=UPI0011165F6D|nr:hypothetical protein [Bradyrhizobium ivorense]